MTNEEAVKIFNTVLSFDRCDCPKDEIKECLKMAIKALEQEPCEDTISRQTLIERINNAEENFKSDNMESIAFGDGDPFVDGVLSGLFNIRQMVMQAPPVTPQPKTGHWIDIMVGDMPAQACDRCNTFYPLAYTGGGHKYCPNCGIKMESEVGGNVPVPGQWDVE